MVNQGVADHRGSNYSHGVRQFIKTYLTSDPEYRITGVRSKTYLADMKDSTFCLAPEGKFVEDGYLHPICYFLSAIS